MPQAGNAFYPLILGGVLFGIGLALLIEAFGGRRGFRGLGMNGAIVINVSGAGVLAVYLASSSLAIPLRGQILLWSIAILVLAISVIELLAGSWRA